jgi:hypothetical protein
MKYLNFVTDKKALDYVTGSPVADIDRVEKNWALELRRLCVSIWSCLG